MITTTSNNTCTRCGKTRIIVRTWTETIKTYSGESIITHKVTACPDANCQEKVDDEIAAAKEKVQRLLREQEAREEERKENRRKVLANKR